MSKVRIQGAEIMPPMGGWSIEMTIKGQKFAFAGGPARIVKAIAEIKKKNNIYKGDDEIWEYCNEIWCSRDPKRCKKDFGYTTVGMRSKIVTYGHALKALIDNGLQAVSQELADDRAKVCSTCPQNKNMESCSSCLKAVNLLTKTLIGNRSTKYDALLKHCGVCGCDIKQKIHYPLNDGDKNVYPNQCWVGREKSKKV